MVRKSKIASAVPHFKVVSEDPDDNIVLNTAYTGRAAYIVTGDKHLLVLKKFKNIEIVTVTKMLEIVK